MATEPTTAHEGHPPQTRTNTPSSAGAEDGPALFCWLAAICCLALLLFKELGDLDHGFYIATGRRVIAGELPSTEFLAPLLGERPLSSQWLLAALIFAAVWDALGPAGLVVLCSLCYLGGFLLAFAATPRRAPAVLALSILAAAVAPRFVERPGCFSVLLLGLIVHTSRLQGRRWSWLIAGVFAVWPWLHAEWIIGLVAFVLLQFDRWRSGATDGLVQAIAPPAAGLLAAVLGFALIHPAGAYPLLGPLRFLGGGALQVEIKEYGGAYFRVWWLVWPGLALAAAGVACTWRLGRRGEALAVAGLLLLCAVIPRATLPAAILALPGSALAVGGAVRSPRMPLALAVLIAALAMQQLTWRRFGLRIDDALNTRGIARALQPATPTDGVVLAEFGWSSLLLSNPEVAQLGIVLDGRQEAFDNAYHADVYLVALTGRRQGVPVPDSWYAEQRIGFYFEPWQATSKPGTPLSGFILRGWQVIGWDNSGTLLAAPYVAASGRFPALTMPPATLQLFGRGGPIGEIWRRATEEERLAQLHFWESEIERLTAQGHRIPRPMIAAGQLALSLGQTDKAAKWLQRAAHLGGHRYEGFGTLTDSVKALTPE